MIPRPFWLGLDPNKPEPLSKILAAIHCYQVAPPRSTSLSSALCFEFVVDHQDHHRLAKGFPELQELAKFLGHEIPFAFEPLTGKLATMSPRMLDVLVFHTYYLITAQFESMGHLPTPAGPLAAKLRIWHASPDRDKNTQPSTPTLQIRSVGAHSPTALIVLTATDIHKSASKYARSFTENPNLRTIAVLQFALPMQINTEKEVQRLAKCSSLSVFTKEVDGKVKTAIDREPLLTPDGNGAMHLWLSDIVEKEDIKKLSDEFIRGRNHTANFTIPYNTIFTNFREYLGIEEEIGGAVKNLVGRSNSGGGGGGGKRPFSTFAGSSNVVSPRSLPIKGNTMPSTRATLLPPAAFFTATTATAKPFVHHTRAPRTARMAVMGRFLTRLGKW